MSALEGRKAPVRQAQPRRTGLVVLFLLIVGLGSFMLGTMVPEPLAAAAGVGVLLSWIFGVAIVAPRAGMIAKQNLMRSFADPTEEDVAMIQSATMHLLHNAGAIAQDEKLHVLWTPIFQGFTKALDTQWEMTVKNLASQRERGVGLFNPENPIDVEDLFNDLKGEIIGSVADPLIDSFGLSDEGKAKAHAYLMMKMSQIGKNNGPKALTTGPGGQGPGGPGGW